MKVAKPFIIPMPSLLVANLDNCLKSSRPDFTYKKIYFYLIINYLAYRMLTEKSETKMIEISMVKWRKKICYNAGKYLNYMRKHKLIDVNNNYKKGIHSKAYKIADKYIRVKDIFEIKIQPQTKLFKKIHNEYKNKRTNKYKEDHLNQMRKKFFSLELDHNKAIKYVMENKDNYIKGIYHLTALYNFTDKRLLYFNRKKNGLMLKNKSRKGHTNNGRLNTNLTTLWKKLRSCLKGNYVSIDLVNSQPFLLYILINSINNNTHIPNTYTPIMKKIKEKSSQVFGIVEIGKYLKTRKNYNFVKDTNLSSSFKEITTSGKFYEEWQNIIEEKQGIHKNEKKETMDDETRKILKNTIFTILFSENRKTKSKEEKRFSESFPELAEIITNLKTKSNKHLPVMLQQIESYIFIDCIAEKLVQCGIVPLTIHDSIIVEENEQEKALEIVKQSFLESFGIVPKFKLEKLNNIKGKEDEICENYWINGKLYHKGHYIYIKEKEKENNIWDNGRLSDREKRDGLFIHDNYKGISFYL